MRAVVCTSYGPPDVLQLREVNKPAPKDKEVLIRIAAATVTAGDCELRGLKFGLSMRILMRLGFGLRRPRKILGQEIAGEIEAVGKDVKSYQVGDLVFASCGFRFGGYAEYQCLKETAVMSTIPSNMTLEEATTVPLGGLESLHFLRLGNIKSGHKVLINGAGGSIGTYGVQIAKSMGAEVTAVDKGGKLDMLSSIGADHVIDYEKEDYTKNRETYDVIFDIVGLSPFPNCMESINDNGVYLVANPKRYHKAQGRRISRKTSKKVVTEFTYQKTEDLVFLKGLIEDGKIESVIDRRFPLDHVADAHRYVETGQKKGNVVITVWSDTGP
jgi:NADPH:quinone reductase-like Zn-dependent oxidoreductase